MAKISEIWNLILNSKKNLSDEEAAVLESLLRMHRKERGFRE